MVDTQVCRFRVVSCRLEVCMGGMLLVMVSSLLELGRWGCRKCVWPGVFGQDS